MYDMEIIINNSQYRHLKLVEEEVKALRIKVKQLEEEAWSVRQQIKQKEKSIQFSKKQLKEVSLNAINLSRKVLISDDLLANQEDKWLRRERELLQKLMAALKVKEQIEEGWKRDKKTFQIGERKHQQYTNEIKTLKEQLLSRETQWQSNKKRYELEIERINLLFKQNQIKKKTYISEVRQPLLFEIESLKKQSKQLRGIVDQKTAKIDSINNERLLERQKNKRENALLNDTLSSFKERCRTSLTSIQLFLANNATLIEHQFRRGKGKKYQICQFFDGLTKQLAQCRKQWVDKESEFQQCLPLVAIERKTIDTEASIMMQNKMLREEIKKLERKFQAQQENAQLEKIEQNRKQRKQISQIGKSMTALANQIEECKREWIDKGNEFRYVLSQVSTSICHTIQEQIQLSRRKIENEPTTKIENELLREELKTLKTQMKEQKDKYQLEISIITSKLNGAEERLDSSNASVRALTQIVQSLKSQQSKSQQTLEQEFRKTSSLQQKFDQLTVQIQEKKRIISDYQIRLEEVRRQSHVQMNTEVIKIQQQALYHANRSVGRGGAKFKQVVDQLWQSIENYLWSKKEQLAGLQELCLYADEIMREEFKLIIKRFVYNFQQKFRVDNDRIASKV